MLTECLERIAACEPDVHAFRELLEPTAGGDGRLTGMPVAVKEIFDVAGLPRSAGTRVPLGGPAVHDAPAVAALRDHGAILIGRTRSHEFAWGITTADQGTRNPLDTNLIAGGSSGGSAAAVAYGGVVAALGTDTGGSIRVPASLCGIVGFKLAYGAMSMDGVVPLAPSLDHGGVLARTVADAALVADVSLGATGRLAASLPETLADPSFAATLAAIDAEPALLPDLAELWQTHQTIQRREAYQTHTETLGTWPRYRDLYTPGVRARFEAAAELTDDEVEPYRLRRKQLTQAVADAIEPFDAVLTYAAPCRPSRFDDPDYVEIADVRHALRDVVMPHMVAANLTGFPAIVIPVAHTPDGWPICAQLMCLPGREPAMLALAQQLES